MTTRARDYSLGGIIGDAIDRRLARVHTAIPGRVVRYDAALQQADVQPLIQVPYVDESGADQAEDLPVVCNVPIVFPGAGKYRITFPIVADAEKGDSVLLVFAEASLDKWLAQGGKSADPDDDRRFHLSDAVAFVGLHDFAHPLASARADAMTMGDDGGLQIHIDGSKIKIGTADGGQLEAACLGNATQTIVDAICSFLGSHTHAAGTLAAPAGTAGGPVTGASGTASGAPSAGTLTSSKVQVMK